VTGAKTKDDDMVSDLWESTEGQGPIAAVALHDGHELREETAALTALSEEERLREEDPHTGVWTTVAMTRLVARRSRFEVDLNRPREKAVYLEPEDAWGLHLWKEELPSDVVARSRAEYDAFYEEAQRVFSEMAGRFGRFVVLDLHSYNHRREGPAGPPADPESNPDVNIGTGSLRRERWGALVDRFMDDLRSWDFLGRRLDVRENVKFRGGHFSRWLHERFPESACCLAIEFKKFFMNEWTGEVSVEEVEAIPRALEATVPGLLESLSAVGPER
jgi:hypothetical protein